MRICKKCGVLFDSRNCPECHRRMNRICARQFRTEHPDLKKEVDAKYHAANKKAVAARIKKWRSNNKDRVLAILRRYRHSHREAFIVYTQNRRAKLRKSGGKLSANLISILYESQKGLCACCRKPLQDNYHLDHRMPIALGGKHEDWNMQLLTQHCNSKKWAKHPDEYESQSANNRGLGRVT